MINVMRVGRLHVSGMADILNDIIDVGGTTAFTTHVTSSELAEWIENGGSRAAWHVAETDGGHVLGFQWIEPVDHLPPEAAEIATFARIGHAGLGIGSALFKVTERVARDLGYAWINADIRADNTGGLAYYQSRGFEDYGRKTGVKLGCGLIVDKVLKRYDL